ncbi:hypothetical protein ERJ75_001190500 [Trypanosoma vivax]|uniref:Transmembrane protein n=1 Tax=Trypanosoma vivax (strain Y486) TaxID=1055687 RepID=G0UBY1_TRYVY|nr:hypothetical protein TRVL_05358 [Trypanosoma vivax]KAH8609591.1 hypothetical protein ERJ75_001190500 [Trypanosoma vivax]CCC53329.1 conserved hypothetical protein [Trypanosoma vivax Y486]
MRFALAHRLPVAVAMRREHSVLLRGQRSFSVFRPRTPRVTLEETRFDKQSVRYTGKIFGVPTDVVVFYAKIGASLCCVFLLVRFFLKGYGALSRFSLATVARLGFACGFVSCAALYTAILSFARRFRINPNAVYNQSIAMAMRNERVLKHLGTSPRTGDFKAYSETGGFRLPLIRRIRSGSYELSDLLGLKPRRMQMMFILRNQVDGREGLVTCDVRREATGFMTSTNTFKSLAVTLTDSSRSAAQTVVLVGRPEDVVYRGLMNL